MKMLYCAIIYSAANFAVAADVPVTANDKNIENFNGIAKNFAGENWRDLPRGCIAVETYPAGNGLAGITMDNNCGEVAHVLWNVFDYNGNGTGFAGWWCRMAVNETRSANFRVNGRGETVRVLGVKSGDERCPQ